MLQVTVTTLRPGSHLSVDRGFWTVLGYEHVKPGKGGAFVRIRMKNLENGSVLEKTLDADAKVSQVDVTEEKAQFLYQGGGKCVFMNLETFEQLELGADSLKEQIGYLKPEMEVKVIECEGRMMGIELPNAVDLKVVETPPGVKGDTVARGTKPAKLETGVTAQVPLFINTGDTVKLDTRSGEYLERV